MYKIAAITDDLTRCALSKDAHIFQLTPFNYRLLLKYRKPDILFVESAWQGWKNKWKYKIAAYPDAPLRNNEALLKVIDYAKSLDIPTVFWNKEDSVHFDRFINSAKYFDYIYTVDENAVEKYKENIGDDVFIDVLPFPVQPLIHYPFERKNIFKKCAFVGSYNRQIHPRRKNKQLMLFRAAQKVGLDIFDRNSNRKNINYRFPVLSENTRVFSKVAPHDTARIYNEYCINLNINTIEDSKTMYSRRFIEILSCEAMTITTPAKSISHYFSDFCYIVNSAEEAEEHINRICQDGLSSAENNMLRAGREYVYKFFSYKNFIHKIMDNIKNPNINPMKSLKELVQ